MGVQTMNPEPVRSILSFEMPSQPGTERAGATRVAEAVKEYLHGEPLERLKTAVAEALMNAIEHGNQGRPELMARVQVYVTENYVCVQVTDNGLIAKIPESTHPDIEAKLAGLERPRGWGLFIIRHMVDEMNVQNTPDSHTIELIFYREKTGDEHKND